MNITCYPYQIPFRKPFKAGNNIYKHREGVILALKEDGITAYGEAAPLPGFSVYNLNDVLAQLKELQSEIRKLLQHKDSRNSAIHFYQEYGLKPSLRFALDTLIIDWLSQKHGQPLADYLLEEHDNHININGVIGSAAQDEMLAQSKSLVNQGFRTLKFKVGSDFDGLTAVLSKVRKENPDIALRIDANQSWSLEEAGTNLAKLDKLNIEYCEEPLNEISPNILSELREATAVPIALDETISQTEQLESLLPYISFSILKPMVIGSLSKLFATKALLSTHDITTVFTSSLESGIGRMMTATLASGLGAKQTAHGLATGSLLTMDVWGDGTYINNGRFTLPDNIGLGKRHKPDFKNIVTQTFEL